MASDPADLQFDHATYSASASPSFSASSSVTPCGECRGPLGDPYWRWQQRVVCAACRGRIQGILGASKSGAAFRKAVVLGSAVALASGLAYAVLSAAIHAHFSLATIAIAYVVARVVRSASFGVGGRRFQVLAVALTYVASAMGYVPGVLEGLRDAGAEQASAPHDAPAAASAPSSTDRAPFVALVEGVAVLFGITMAAPVLTFPDAPLGLLIVGIGLFEAWKRSRGVPLALDGPYRATAPTS